MKLLHSPFKYKTSCTYCKSEISFKDQDIVHNHSYGQKIAFFELDEEIKKALINNSKDKHISNYLAKAVTVKLLYYIIQLKIDCPYCGYEIYIKTSNGQELAIVEKYILLDLTNNFIAIIDDFSSTASYIMYNKHLIPKDLKL